MLSKIDRSEKRGLALTLPAVLLAALGHFMLSATASFFLALLALAALAWMIGFATEHLAAHAGPAVTSILHTTIGNIPAFLIIFFALQGGQVVVAETTLVGSILSNGLLVLGLVFIAGSLAAKDGVMRFSTRLPNDTITLLGISAMAVALIGISQLDGGYSPQAIRSASIVTAILVLGLYLVWLKNYLRGEGRALREGEKVEGKMSLLHSLLLLVFSVALAALLADWLIGDLEPALQTLNVSESFIGLVIIAIAGNASMNYTAIMMAAKGRSELAVALVKNSISQVPAFLYPSLVLASLLVGTTLTFALPPVLIISLVLSGILIWQVSGNGEVDFFGGAALVTAFLVIAALLFFS